MEGEPPVPAKRRGRPTDRDSTETRRAIIDNARRLFAERGYSAVTNKELAEAAGITTGALYHYVESKLDLYVLVHRDMQRQIYGRFQEAIAQSDTFIGKLEGVLEAAADLDERDPTLTLFIGTVRTDMRRFTEIEERLAMTVSQRDDFFVSIVDVGVATGEICHANRDLVVEFLRVVLVGLTEGVSSTPGQHRVAIDSIRAAVRGELVVGR
ncbi:MAG: TetR/AcrR family transcriptional regulator [Ilumatobacteraceae bacterium]